MSKCTIIIKDEVNVKLEGLDPSTRRKCSDKLKYFLPHAFHMPAYKLGRWDGTVRFCDVGGRTFLNLLDDVLPVIIEQGYEVVIDDRRKNEEMEFEYVTENFWEGVAWPEGHPASGRAHCTKRLSSRCNQSVHICTTMSPRDSHRCW